MQWYSRIEQAGLSQHVLIVTGRGYSDFGTRRFLQLLTERDPNLSMFYIGDADPFGAEIFFTYLFGSLTSCIIENKSHCSTLFAMEWIGPFMQDYTNVIPRNNMLKLNSKDKLKIFSLLSKPYLADIYINQVNNEGEEFLKFNLRRYKDHLKAMMNQDCKFEVEALLTSSDFLL